MALDTLSVPRDTLSVQDDTRDESVKEILPITVLPFTGYLLCVCCLAHDTRICTFHYPLSARKLISELRTHVARHDRHDRQLVLASLNICQTSSESFRCASLSSPPSTSLPHSLLLCIFYTLSCSFVLLIVCILFLFACLAAPIHLPPAPKCSSPVSFCLSRTSMNLSATCCWQQC